MPAVRRRLTDQGQRQTHRSKQQERGGFRDRSIEERIREAWALGQNIAGGIDRSEVGAIVHVECRWINAKLSQPRIRNHRVAKNTAKTIELNFGSPW
jgi:hypothetical protein